jgi:glycerol 3-phosphatase-1
VHLLHSIQLDWTITYSSVSYRLSVLKLPIPEHLVVAEDVENGKPDPSCYLLGREKLGLTADAEVLVLEDSPAGIEAGKAAGCKVLGVVTSHTIEQVLNAGPDWIVKDLRSVRVVGHSQEGVELEFSNGLEVK